MCIRDRDPAVRPFDTEEDWNLHVHECDCDLGLDELAEVLPVGLNSKSLDVRSPLDVTYPAEEKTNLDGKLARSGTTIVLPCHRRCATHANVADGREFSNVSPFQLSSRTSGPSGDARPDDPGDKLQRRWSLFERLNHKE